MTHTPHGQQQRQRHGRGAHKSMALKAAGTVQLVVAAARGAGACWGCIIADLQRVCLAGKAAARGEEGRKGARVVWVKGERGV